MQVLEPLLGRMKRQLNLISQIFWERKQSKPQAPLVNGPER